MDIGNIKICTLMFADDIVIFTEKPEDLQKLLTSFHEWCNKWRMIVNVGKSKIVHFRKSNLPRSTCTFKLGDVTLDYVDKYKYLGIVLEEFLNYSVTAKVLSDSGGRALGAIIAKYKYFNDMNYVTYTKLYENCVNPVMEYCSGIWGFQKFNFCEQVQNRAIRIFLGVHRFAPTLALQGDMGWHLTHHRRHSNMLRFWNRLIKMPGNRLTKKIFLWDYHLKNNNWSSDIETIFRQMDTENVFDNMHACDVNESLKFMYNANADMWKNNLKSKPKLRTYVTFKESFGRDKYLYNPMSKRERSLMAQLRMGILPLNIEVGRFRNLPVSERTCSLCNENVTENEFHFLFHCQNYTTARQYLYQTVLQSNPNFLNLVDSEKCKILFNNFSKHLSRYILKAFLKRRDDLYSKL